MDISNTLGVLGAVIVLFGFIMNQTGRWSDKHVRYDATNVIGSGMLYGKDMPPRMPKPGQPKRVEG